MKGSGGRFCKSVGDEITRLALHVLPIKCHLSYD